MGGLRLTLSPGSGRRGYLPAGVYVLLNRNVGLTNEFMATPTEG